MGTPNLRGYDFRPLLGHFSSCCCKTRPGILTFTLAWLHASGLYLDFYVDSRRVRNFAMATRNDHISLRLADALPDPSKNFVCYSPAITSPQFCTLRLLFSRRIKKDDAFFGRPRLVKDIAGSPSFFISTLAREDRFDDVLNIYLYNRSHAF